MWMRIIFKEMWRAALCLLLICISFTGCEITSASKITTAIESDLVEAFFQSQEESVSTLNLKDSEKQDIQGIDEYTTSAIWCGKELPTILYFKDGRPLYFSATETLPEEDAVREDINVNLAMFEKQFSPKSIDIVMDRETGSGKTVEYEADTVAEAIQTFCGTDDPGLICFKFLIPRQEESRTQVEYTLKKGPDTSNKTEANYAIIKNLERNPG